MTKERDRQETRAKKDDRGEGGGSGVVGMVGRSDADEGLEERVPEPGVRFVVREHLLDLVDQRVPPDLDGEGLFGLQRGLVEALGLVGVPGLTGECRGTRVGGLGGLGGGGAVGKGGGRERVVGGQKVERDERQRPGLSP